MSLTVLIENNLVLAGCFQEKQYAGVKINALHPIEKKPGDEKPLILNKDAWIVCFYLFDFIIAY